MDLNRVLLLGRLAVVHHIDYGRWSDRHELSEHPLLKDLPAPVVRMPRPTAALIAKVTVEQQSPSGTQHSGNLA